MHVMIWYVDVIEIGDALIFPANHINVTGKGCSIGLGREISGLSYSVVCIFLLSFVDFSHVKVWKSQNVDRHSELCSSDWIR